jgi:hypothetical protein
VPSPAGWREVPCIECGEFVVNINFGDRCPACQRRRVLRARRVSRRVALVATLLSAAWVLTRMPASPLGRWYAGLSVAATYLLVRLIAGRIAMEVLK